MAFKACPDCKQALQAPYISCGCGWQMTGQTVGKSVIVRPPIQLSAWAILAAEAAARFEAGKAEMGPHRLTDQQWYNVCKYWPRIVRLSQTTRPWPTIGPSNPLDATSTAGSLFAATHRRTVAGIAMDDEAVAEREAIQAEANNH